MMFKSFAHAYNKIMKVLNTAAGILAAGILATLFAAMILEISSRFLFRISHNWVLDYAQFGLTYVVFLAGSILFYQEDHISITMIPDKIPPRELEIAKIFFNLIILFFLQLLFRSGYVYAMLGKNAYSASRLTLLIYPRLAVPIGTAMMALQVLNNLFKSIDKLMTLTPEDWRKLKEKAKSHEEKEIEKAVEEIEELSGEGGANQTNGVKI